MKKYNKIILGTILASMSMIPCAQSDIFYKTTDDSIANLEQIKVDSHLIESNYLDFNKYTLLFNILGTPIPINNNSPIDINNNPKTEKISSYEKVVSNYSGNDLNISMAQFFDDILENENVPNSIINITEAINNNANSGDEVVQSFDALQAVSNRIYSHSLHSNTIKMSRTFATNLTRVRSSSPWFLTQSSISSLESSNDVIGYKELSGGLQTGYSLRLNNLSFGLAGGYVRGIMEGEKQSYDATYNNYNGSFGISYSHNNLYTTAALSYSQASFNTEKNFFFNENNVIKNPKYEVNTSEILGRLEFGYTSYSSRGFYSKYSLFYSIGYININSYNEEGESMLSIKEGKSLVNDLGLSSTFSKVLLYSETMSLSPFIRIDGGLRHFSDAKTDFEFTQVEEDGSFTMSAGDYLPIFINGSLGISYTYQSFSMAAGYALDTNTTESFDNSFFIQVGYDF